MLKHLPGVALAGSLLLSVINVIASVFGLGAALSWATGVEFWFGITIPLAMIGIGFFIYSWVNSLMSNFAGMAIYFVNIALAPFGYEFFGLPYFLGFIFALAPLPFYLGLSVISDKLD